MEERIEALEQIQRTSFEAQKHMLEAMDGLQKQITSLFKISNYLSAALALLSVHGSPAVKELSQQALAEIAELEALFRREPGQQGGKTL